MPNGLVVRAIHFLDDMHGYAAGGTNSVADTTKIMYTADGGASWSEIDWEVSDFDEVVKIFFWSTMEGYVSIDTQTGQSRVHYTMDGGQSWNLSSGGGRFRDVEGGLGVGGVALLFSTSSPGASWSAEEIPDPEPSSPLNTYGVTTQGGKTWIAGGLLGAYVAYKEGGVWTTDWNPGQGSGINELVDIEMFSATEGVAIGFAYMARRIPE